MPPPLPATPSPHRFLPGQRKAQPTPKDTKPPSALRSQLVHPPVEDDKHAQSSQFAPTPRFSYGRSKATTSSQRPRSPPKPTLVQALRASAQHAGDVEEAAAEDDEMLDFDQAQVRETTEREPTLEGTHLRWTNDLALSPKRRRLQHGEAFSSQEQSALEEEQLAVSHLSANETPRFTHSFAQPTQSSITVEGMGTQGMSTQRPAFIRPPAQLQEPSEPLPEAFSPHRRGQKFVTGGMAATVQQWVLETGQAAVQSRKGQGYWRGDDYVMRVKIEEEVEGNGPFTVRAKLSNGDPIDLLLAGGKDASRIHPGSVVGIRVPTWKLDIGESSWTVGVDWTVLS